MEEINLTYIIKSLFINRENFGKLTSEDKAKNGFIVNRMLSAKYPDYALKLNRRTGDFEMILNLWYLYIGNEIIKTKSRKYSWVWGGLKGKKTSSISNKEEVLLYKYYPHYKTLDFEYYRNIDEKGYKNLVKNLQKIEDEYNKN